MASIESKNEMLETIDGDLDRFVVPILVGKTNQLDANGLRNGTGLLVRNNEYMLVTCNHIWNEWRTVNSGKMGSFVVLLGSGYTAVEIIPASIHADASADLAAVHFPPTQMSDSQKAYYPLDELGFVDASPGDILIAIGYPGMWRQSGHHQSTLRRSLFPFVVSDISHGGFVAAEAVNCEVLNDLDAMAAGLGRDQDALGGLSGAPVFNAYERPFKLAGFVRERGCGGLFFAHARSLVGHQHKTD
jgi:hypothetical protein